jgi:hypothetical protein
MMKLEYIASVVALSLTAALAGTGCMAQPEDDPATNAPEATSASSDPQDEQRAAPTSCPKDEKETTGDAKQACWSGAAFPWFGLGGIGWPYLGRGGAALFPFIGCGGCGGCGGFGGFGGCGGW